ncbi:metalloprotease [Alsobacter metallidurans]|uniref:Metalloprotease n=1 Tax=Alsobacter metallidurans TaxID=340221 RepID=A0A917IBI8_9HYPH|nr:metalloprotease [Alsobacter metallidurans]
MNLTGVAVRVRARVVPFAAALALALGLAGCASDRIGFGAGTAPSLPASAPRVTGVEPVGNREHKRLVANFGGEYRAPVAERLLNDVMKRVAAATDRPDQQYQVTILNSPVVNAFALPSGNLYVTRGLLALANDTSEVAAVMAHEVAHVTLSHAMQRAELERRSEIVSRVVSEVLNDRDAQQVVQARGKLTLASFSRSQELEADQIGVRTIAKAGFDPFGAARFLASLGRQSAMRATMLGEKGSQGPNFLSTHPSTPERVSQALTAARQIRAPGIGDTDRERYLQAISGMTFGDDPSEGVVRGNRFMHPQLGFAFTAPASFVLENSASAVLGLAPGGAQALRFDSVKMPDGVALPAYIVSGWIEGVEVGPVETLTVNGLPAVTTVAKGEEWTFRLAAVQAGQATYRFILAAKNYTPETDRSFRQAIESLHLMSPEEASGVKPLKVGLVTAQAGDTVETLATRMATDRPVERFQLLNGIERNGPVRAGTVYKIIVE